MSGLCVSARLVADGIARMRFVLFSASCVPRPVCEWVRESQMLAGLGMRTGTRIRMFWSMCGCFSTAYTEHNYGEALSGVLPIVAAVTVIGCLS